jgi:hypothetical protein
MKKFRTSGTIWYASEVEYFAFRDVCADKENFYPTYAEWLSKAQAQVESFCKQGMGTVKVKADIGEFLGWCKVNSARPDGKSRSIFASIKSREKTGQG